MSVFSTESPSYAEVLRVRAERQAMVRDYLAGIGAVEWPSCGSTLGTLDDR